jgi:hypothetical protein
MTRYRGGITGVAVRVTQAAPVVEDLLDHVIRPEQHRLGNRQAEGLGLAVWRDSPGFPNIAQNLKELHTVL